MIRVLSRLFSCMDTYSMVKMATTFSRLWQYRALTVESSWELFWSSLWYLTAVLVISKALMVESFLISGEKLQGSGIQCNSEDKVCKLQRISSEVGGKKKPKSTRIGPGLHRESVSEQRVQIGALEGSYERLVLQENPKWDSCVLVWG